MKSRPALIAFVGPSLARAAAEEVLHKVAPRLRAEVWGPARQGDVWRALGQRPRALALIDGLFESAPSVWHHELLDALDAGVLVFGAASMGALRAAELQGQGMIGVGAIFLRFAARARGGAGSNDDAAVALLHASEEQGFRPLTAPLVNVEHALGAALDAGALDRAAHARCLQAARALHYQERTWDAVLAAAKLPPAARARWDAFAARGLPDLKADDARLCLREAALAAQGTGARPPARPRPQPSSALVRHRRLLALLGAAALPDAPAEQALAEEGLQTLLLAGLSRAAGLVPTSAEIEEAREALRGGRSAEAQEDHLRTLFAAEDEVARAAETLALARLALAHAPRLLPDGPGPAEGLRLARLLRR
jgi:hypothetical protein